MRSPAGSRGLALPGLFGPGAALLAVEVAIAIAIGLGLAPAPARGGGPVVPARRPRPFLRGVTLSLHDEDPEQDYSDEVADVASRLPVSHLSVVLHLYQPSVTSPVPARGARTPTEETVRRTLRAAREHGLATLLVPVVLLESPRSADEWRGRLAPPDPEEWLRAYEVELLAWARLAAEEKVAALSVGSELGWSHAREKSWRRIVASVRAVFPGELTYSANWDDHESVPFWDALDLVGLSGYFELAKAPGATEPELAAAWGRVRDDLLSWHARSLAGKPLLFTEVGYPSQRGAAMHPWNHLASTVPDPEEQRRAYEAFVATWAPVRELQGVFFYEWWGEGGLEDTQYTPRDKPAEGVVRRFFGDILVVERGR